MLEAITDFWKPAKKSPPPHKLKLADMQIGSIVGFGYVPQVALSGRRLVVTAINSYQFGQDVLTSFVLSNEKDTDVSMIIADAQGEQYLAISRRISISDRIKLFDDNAIADIISNSDVSKFMCRDNIPELKGWLVPSYKREIQGMRGHIYKADFRGGNDGLQKGDEFQYTLLGSDSNEHAIEIESYDDGRIDVYATIYRRTNDISEIIHSARQQQPEIKLSSKDTEITATEKKFPTLGSATAPAVAEKPEEKLEVIKNEPVINEPVKAEIQAVEPEEVKPEPVATEEQKAEAQAEPVKDEVVKMESSPLVEAKEPPPAEEIKKLESIITKPTTNSNEEKKIMSSYSNEVKSTNGNGQAGEVSSSPIFSSAVAKDFSIKQEVKPVNKAINGLDNEAVECDLRVANQIIEEAIRNEMRLSDVVRRIIELPVAHQEAVQIPINLADEDYSLLAIRYGIPASDRNAIKLRIIQDLSDFSGKKKAS
jgi:hypothetical protein